MANLRLPPGSGACEFLGFNQDASAFFTCGKKGVVIHSLESNTKVLQIEDLGPIRQDSYMGRCTVKTELEVVATHIFVPLYVAMFIQSTFSSPSACSFCSMLYCTSLLAYCPTTSPRKLVLFNTATRQRIQTLTFPSPLLAVQMSRKFLCAVTEARVFLYALESVELLCSINTSNNPRGLLALSQDSDYLALPGCLTRGLISVRNLSDPSNGGTLLEFNAHQSPLAAFAWSDGPGHPLIASASVKGTVVRVHSMPQGSKLFTLRRGSTPARISLAFVPGPRPHHVLCAGSDHGTVHVWQLQHHHPRNPIVAVAGHVISAVVPKTLPENAGEKLLALRLLCKKGTSVVVSARNGESGEGAKLAVATSDAHLYTYRLEGFDGHELKCTLEGEWRVI
jgi:hypothetical protein